MRSRLALAFLIASVSCPIVCAHAQSLQGHVEHQARPRLARPALSAVAQRALLDGSASGARLMTDVDVNTFTAQAAKLHAEAGVGRAPVHAPVDVAALEPSAMMNVPAPVAASVVDYGAVEQAYVNQVNQNNPLVGGVARAGVPGGLGIGIAGLPGSAVTVVARAGAGGAIGGT